MCDTSPKSSDIGNALSSSEAPSAAAFALFSVYSVNNALKVVSPLTIFSLATFASSSVLNNKCLVFAFPASFTKVFLFSS